MRISFSLKVCAARVVADLVAPRRVGNRDVLVAVGQRQQHFADAADRPADRQRAEHRNAGEHRDDEQPDADIDTADAIALLAGLDVAGVGGRDQRRRRALDLRAHGVAELAGPLHLRHRVAVLLGGGGKLVADADVVLRQLVERLQAVLFGRIAAETHGVGDVL
jgi:hypothetical protein